MKIVIVYESMFGNTEALAGDVRDGMIAAGADVRMTEVATELPPELEGCDLVVLAAPTHALTLSRPATRADAVTQGAGPDHATTGVREWLALFARDASATTKRPAVAVFDTRVAKVRRLPGSAAARVGRTVTKAGFTVVDRCSFYVEGTRGPLVAGEHERARQWGSALVVASAGAVARRPV